MLRVAVAEANPAQRALMSGWLTTAGHQCVDFDRGDALIRACTLERFDAVLVNWNLGGTSGVEVLKQLRMHRRGWLPVVFVGARDNEDDIVTALRHGADGYLFKPVRPLELIARLEAIARRGKPTLDTPHALDVEEFQVDLRGRILLRHAHPVQLTAKDFDLSALFLSNVSRLLSRYQIRERVWGPAVGVTSRSLDTHVCRIRGKLRLTPGNGWQLQAVYRNGYRLRRLDAGAIGALPVDEECVTEA
jgi:DNA-binding response OmpR family regulator